MIRALLDRIAGFFDVELSWLEQAADDGDLIGREDTPT